MTMEINLEIQNDKRSVRIEELLHIDINHNVREMMALLEEAKATGKKFLYDGVSVCLVFKLPECFVSYLQELPINGHFKYNNHKIQRVSKNLYVVNEEE